MTNQATEHLLVVDEPERFEAIVAAVGATAPVIQQLPPRLAIVASPASGQQLPQVSGATWYREGAAIDERLSAEELLFVTAWRQRRRTKDRPGEGLPWDAPGYQPPDAPR